MSFVKPDGLLDGHPATSKVDLLEGMLQKILDILDANPSLKAETALLFGGFALLCTLTAVNSAVMVLDAAKDIEEQTRKLFEVCRLRDVPIITFVNKLDREGCDPFDLLEEIE